MQRTKRKLEARERKRQEAEMKKECFGNEDDSTPSASQRLEFQFSSDLTVLEGLKFGRMSFKGCNPEVEKLMVYYERKRNGDLSDSDSDDGKDVGDMEMATTLRGGAKASRGRNRQSAPAPATGLNETSTGAKLNFIDVRKRGAQPSWTGSPKKTRKSR
ncbi:hypothetical protein GCK32_010932 [Trichostrongylus colubriformis]|uniref:M-phase phosphoprotein 6 n=1 Tax=Trichostrongylus colubriformis TaxID=6319 RepID=A0AAN8IWU8_TRICO